MTLYKKNGEWYHYEDGGPVHEWNRKDAEMFFARKDLWIALGRRTLRVEGHYWASVSNGDRKITLYYHHHSFAIGVFIGDKKVWSVRCATQYDSAKVDFIHMMIPERMIQIFLGEREIETIADAAYLVEGMIPERGYVGEIGHMWHGNAAFACRMESMAEKEETEREIFREYGIGMSRKRDVVVVTRTDEGLHWEFKPDIGPKTISGEDPIEGGSWALDSEGVLSLYDKVQAVYKSRTRPDSQIWYR